MNVETFREALRRFAGNAQYRKFIRTMTTSGRGTGSFLYWQEKLWKRFITEYPEYVGMTHLEVEKALNLCHLHLLELREEEVKAHYARWRYPQDFRKSREHSFPFANMVYFGDISAKIKPKVRKICFCEECRRELIRWNARRKEKFGIE